MGKSGLETLVIDGEFAWGVEAQTDTLAALTAAFPYPEGGGKD